MTIRSYLASLSLLAVVANPANVWAQPTAAGWPPAGPPPAYPYREGMLVPQGYRYHVEMRPRKGLVWGGVGVFSAFYGFTTLGAAGKDPAAPYLLVPFAGPVIYSSRHECPAPCDDMATGPVMFMFAAGQITGALLFSMGFAMPKAWIVPDPVAAETAPRVAVVPRVDRSNQGLALVGTF